MPTILKLTDQAKPGVPVCKKWILHCLSNCPQGADMQSFTAYLETLFAAQTVQDAMTELQNEGSLLTAEADPKSPPKSVAGFPAASSGVTPEPVPEPTPEPLPDPV